MTQPMAITRDEARRIAEDYIRTHSVGDATGVESVVTWEEIGWRPPLIYGFGDDFLRTHWVVYLDRPRLALRSSLILLVDQATGRVDYAGEANDEG